MGKGNASEHEIRNRRADEMEMGEILDGHRLERQAPGVVQSWTQGEML